MLPEELKKILRRQGQKGVPDIGKRIQILKTKKKKKEGKGINGASGFRGNQGMPAQVRNT